MKNVKKTWKTRKNNEKKGETTKKTDKTREKTVKSCFAEGFFSSFFFIASCFTEGFFLGPMSIDSGVEVLLGGLGGCLRIS